MEKRTLEITLEKAREWYKKGGELKEIALQAYSEKELKDVVPMSWKEYRNNIPVRDYYCATCDEVTKYTGQVVHYDSFSTKEEAKAFCALGKLIQLRDAWLASYNNGEGWEPDWIDDSQVQTIGHVDVGVRIYPNYHYVAPLTFPTYEMAYDFYNTFKDLIEEAKPLL